MKSLSRIFLFVFFLFSSFLLYSQITITEVNKIEENVVLKPAPYDSLKNWEGHEMIGDYKQYIGLQLYLPPFDNPQKDVEENGYRVTPFLFSPEPHIIKIDTDIEELKLSSYFNQTYTPVYKPHLNSGDQKYQSKYYFTNSNEIGNSYFTIINVIYSNVLRSWIKKTNSLIKEADLNSKNQENSPQKIYVDKDYSLAYDEYNSTGNKFNKVFVLRSDLNGDTIYCIKESRFILVPFFVKQKELFQNKKLIYDDRKDDYGSYKYPEFEEFDARYIIKSENDRGIETSNGKKVTITRGSKWICSEVTLMKTHRKKSYYDSYYDSYYEPTHAIYYILKNDKDEQIALTSIKGFIEEQDYIKREADKKMQKEQLLARQLQEKQAIEENNKIATKKHREECINLFGQQNGEIISQGKVKVGMSKEMCKYAWGTSLWTNKTTTDILVIENWYYGLGYYLHFENGILTRIQE